MWWMFFYAKTCVISRSLQGVLVYNFHKFIVLRNGITNRMENIQFWFSRVFHPIMPNDFEIFGLTYRKITDFKKYETNYNFLILLFILFLYCIQNPRSYIIYAKTSIKSLLLFIWKCRPNISSGLTVQFPYLENSAQGECWKWGGLGFFFFFILYLEWVCIWSREWKQKRNGEVQFLFIHFIIKLFIICRDGI